MVEKINFRPYDGWQHDVAVAVCADGDPGASDVEFDRCVSRLKEAFIPPTDRVIAAAWRMRHSLKNQGPLFKYGLKDCPGFVEAMSDLWGALDAV